MWDQNFKLRIRLLEITIVYFYIILLKMSQVSRVLLWFAKFYNINQFIAVYSDYWLFL